MTAPAPLGPSIINKHIAKRAPSRHDNTVHMCKTQRGVRASHRSRMVNTYYWGELASDTALKGEFLQECATLDRAGAA